MKALLPFLLLPLLQDPFPPLPPPPPDTEIRVDEVIDVELQQLYVTVTRPIGGAALGLTAADFEILDDGEPQAVSTFSRGDLALSLQKILRELREQYVLGFQPAKDRDDGAWHKLEVRVRGGYRARTREGYFDR
ncbi:MAG TPA: hypothetical protein VN493_12500 [Thermoanaerobaculia bacterium]|nr:hypothetical protein [Thermoanaerobaculia bacterium]